VTDEDLAYASIADLGVALRAKTVTAAKLVEVFLARIERLQPKLNAFITVTADVARREAAAADAELAGGRDRGPLHGIPYAAKDLLDTAGITTTWGTKALLDRVPATDARVVTQLRDAGAVLLGKLCMSELANGLDSEAPGTAYGGPTRNPWRTDLWAGGSSSGSGASVAAGLCTFAIGSETWGSIDCPAAFCGVTGLRPTFGVVDRAGAMLICPTLDKLGPLARSGADCALVLDALATDLEPPPRRPLRIGVVPPPAGPPGYLRLVADAVGVLAEDGASLEYADLPAGPFEHAMWVILSAEVFGTLSGFIERGDVDRMYDERPWAERSASYYHAGLRADDYVKSAAVRTLAMQGYQVVFERYDVLLTGGRLNSLMPADAKFADVTWLPDGGQAALQEAGNLIGAPGITLPIGLLDGIPYSMHAIAAPHRDRDLVALAAQYQARTNHHRARPPVEG